MSLEGDSSQTTLVDPEERVELLAQKNSDQHVQQVDAVATRSCDQVIELNPLPSETESKAVEVACLNQDSHPSSDDLEKASDLFNQAVVARDARQLDRSIELLTEAIAICPSNANYHAIRSLVYSFKGGKTEQALQDAEQSLSIAATFVGYQAMGNALGFLDRYDEAMVEFNKGLALGGNNPDEASMKHDMAAFYADQVTAAMSAKEYSRAAELASKAIEFEPSSPLYYAYRGFSLGLADGDYSLALQDADKSLSINLTPGGYLAKGSILRLLGRYDEALNELMKGWRMNMSDRDRKALSHEAACVYAAQAVATYHSGQFQQTVELIERAIQMSPTSDYYAVRSLAYTGMSDLSCASRDAKKALELDKTARAHHAMGVVHNMKKKHDKALNELELALALVGVNDTKSIEPITEQKAMAFYGKGVYAGNAGRYGEAIEWISKAIELFPSRALFYLDRSLARLNIGKDILLALQDAETSLRFQATPEAHRMKGVILSQLKRFDEARVQFDLGFAVASTDHQRENLAIAKANYLPKHAVPNPQGWNDPNTISRDVRQMAQEIVAKTPTRLFDTRSGLLCGKDDRLQVFINSEEYKELISKAISGDISEPQEARRMVAKFFEYGMLSHRWEIGEPMLRHVQKNGYTTLSPGEGPSVSALVKLRKFCSVVTSLGYRWAWSDTCCIDKGSSTELQKSIISMVVWYHRSAITIIYLSDVDNDSPESLSGSLWFKRGWTLQELLSPPIVQFYKADWTPYMDGNDVPFNHKEHGPFLDLLHDITGIEKCLLRHYTPNMDDAREKLRWAASRQTTEEEDSAYSLMGVFNIQIPVMYGESQDKALGRLLQELVGYSSDLSILQWRGTSGSFNSCIPNDISAFNEKPFVPTTSANELQEMATRLRHKVTRKAKARLSDIFVVPHSSPTFLHSRLVMSCIAHDLDARMLTSDIVGLKGLKSFRVEELRGITRGYEYILVRPLTIRLAAPLVKRSMFGRDVGEITEKLALLQQPFYGLVLFRSEGGYYKRLAGIVVEVEDVVQYAEGMRVERLEIA